MHAFACQRCFQVVSFEALSCSHCGAELGFDPATACIEALERQGRDLTLLTPGPSGTPRRQRRAGRQFRRCAQVALTGCNWLVPSAEGAELCASCRLTRRAPAQANAAYFAAFGKAEVAKRRLLFQLGQLRLPIVSRDQDPVRGLAFDLLAKDRHVVTGHDNGIITIDLNETDDVFREQARAQFGEPYRTLLGHFRHEIGHYYWRLVVGPSQTAEPGLASQAAAVFGDHSSSYDMARKEHYGSGPRSGWQEQYVSSYASMHPLEDWAETFAHYLHIRDTVQTAGSFGVLVTGPVDDRTGRRDPAHASVPSEDTAQLEGFDAVISDWRPLTVALNAINRSMGRDDLYPFELAPAVVAKLAFVHKVITAAGNGAAGNGAT